MTIDQHGEYLAGLESLPLEADAPAFEEEPRPALAFVAPQLAKALLENVVREEQFYSPPVTPSTPSARRV
jgi:hypothetical protein